MTNAEVATGKMSCHVTLLCDIVKMQIPVLFIRVSNSYSTASHSSDKLPGEISGVVTPVNLNIFFF